MKQKIFTAQALTKTYTSGETEVRALRGVDLEVWAAEVVVLLGRAIGACRCRRDSALAARFKSPPRRTFVTHGEPAAADALRHRIEEELGWPVMVPEHAESVELG
jgi:hypothetical protein